MSKKIHIRIRPEDRARIELIRGVYGTSMAAIVRQALVALCKQLGIPDPNDPMKNK